MAEWLTRDNNGFLTGKDKFYSRTYDCYVNFQTLRPRTWALKVVYKDVVYNGLVYYDDNGLLKSDIEYDDQYIHGDSGEGIERMLISSFKDELQKITCT